MLVKHDTASSVATEDGEIHGKDGIFDVPLELGERLIRLFGFRPHEGAAPDDSAPVKVPRKRQPKKDAPAATEPAAEPVEGAAPDDSAPTE